MRRTLLFLFLALLVLSSGCQRKSSVRVPSAPAPKAPPDAAAPTAVTPKTWPAPLESSPIAKVITGSPGNLELGKLYFRLGKYTQAAKELDVVYLNSNPDAKDRDEALFLIGLCRALAGDGRDLHQAEAAFKRLISEFPNSVYKSQAEFLLGLQAQIDKLRTDVKERDEKTKSLSEELQVLKEIDLQRRPSRPKE